MVKVSLSNTCLTRFIWPSRDMQVETVFAIWSSYVRLGSSIIPRSFADLAGVSSLPSKDKWRPSTLRTNGRLPKTTNFVLSELSKSLLAKVHLHILCRSSFILLTVSCWSFSLVLWTGKIPAGLEQLFHKLSIRRATAWEVCCCMKSRGHRLLILELLQQFFSRKCTRLKSRVNDWSN